MRARQPQQCLLFFALTVVTFTWSSPSSAFGEPAGGFPSWSERTLHTLVNRARMDPQTALAGCSQCADLTCYQAQTPIYYDWYANVAARFHADEMHQMSYGGHDSVCTIVPNIASLYPAGCQGQPFCSCVGNTMTCSPTCTTAAERVKLFDDGAALVGESFFQNVDPFVVLDTWLLHPSASTLCSSVPANADRWLLLKGSGSMGAGVGQLFSVVDLVSKSLPITMPAGSHYPWTGDTIDFWTIWYADTPPAIAALNVDGACSLMELERGSAHRGAYHAQRSGLGTGCHRYYFHFQSQQGVEVTFPTTGSFGIGSWNCPDWSIDRPSPDGTCTTLDAGAPDAPADAPTDVPADTFEDVASDVVADGPSEGGGGAAGAGPEASVDAPMDSTVDAHGGSAGSESDAGSTDAQVDASAGSGGGSGLPPVAPGPPISDFDKDCTCRAVRRSSTSWPLAIPLLLALAAILRRRSARLLGALLGALVFVAATPGTVRAQDGGLLPLGSPCGEGSACESQICQDHVCCDTACEGQCEFCDAAGKCRPQAGVPWDWRPPCEGESPCKGQCDGLNRETCTYFEGPITNCQGNLGCDGNDFVERACDGAGACVEVASSCAPFVCLHQCKDECFVQEDCVESARCSEGVCVFRTVPECEADALGTRQPDGTIASCAPYLCDETTGACASDCARDKDCAEGHVCRSAQCISAEDRPKVGLYDEDGCHCAQAGRGRDDRVAWLSSLLLLMLLRRRKRRPVRKGLALHALGVMALASTTVLLLGCTNPRKDLPPEEVCIDTGYSIANRIQACTGDNELATDVWNAFKDEYQCLVTKTDKTIEEYYVCPVQLRQTPCEIVEASVQGDLDDWLGTVPICIEVLAHTSGERIEPVVAADAGGGS